MTVRVPIGDGARLAEIYRMGEVVSREQLNGVFELRVRLDPAEMSRLRSVGLEFANPSILLLQPASVLSGLVGHAAV